MKWWKQGPARRGELRVFRDERVELAPEPSAPKERVDHTNFTYVEHVVQTKLHEMFPGHDPDEMNHTNCSSCYPETHPQRDQKVVPSRELHVFYKTDLALRPYGKEEKREPVPPSKANIVSSEIEGHDDAHTVMLDIDIPAALIPSSTPGHSHLYIDKKLSWEEYKKLLDALLECGIIEPGYHACSIKNQATSLRPPWVKK